MQSTRSGVLAPGRVAPFVVAGFLLGCAIALLRESGDASFRRADQVEAVTGLPVLENDEMAAAQHDTRMASWLAIAGVTLLFFGVYRGIAYPLLTVLTLLIGALVAKELYDLTVPILILPLASWPHLKTGALARITAQSSEILIEDTESKP